MDRLHEILIGTKDNSKEIGKLQRQGLVRKIAPRLYTSALGEDPEKIVRRNWYVVLSLLFPDALLSHRSALERMPTKGGHLYLTRRNKGVVQLPGLILHFYKGRKAFEDDAVFFGNLKASSLPRAYLENLQRKKSIGEESKALTRDQIEEKIETFLRVKGAEAVNKVRDRAKEISPLLSMEKEFQLLNQIITGLLGTGLSKNLVSPIARARALGEPIDKDRIELFEQLYEQLIQNEYPDYVEQNTSIKSYQNFAFYESYFSNYIEGTEFTVKEARQIITTATPLPARNEDSHDILGTYKIVSSRQEMSILPKSPPHFLELQKERHGILLRERKTKNPGEFKDKNNRAGNTEFVDKELVSGTLKKGYDWYRMLQHPFAKAAYIMFLISEVHPFLDGNGRIARIMMNAELSAKGMSKIIIPTVYREDYLLALKKLTKQRNADAYLKMMLRSWQFSSHVHSEGIDEMEDYLKACDAFLSPKEGFLKIVDENA